MATLVLSTVGSAIGGPIGQTVGAIIGNQIDRAVFSGGGSREGPRLKELSVTTSSYGQPIPRQFGRMRVAGTVIWATDIQESSETEGGKGRPSTTIYSYSASFAVALSSTPLNRIGRIWADGNLLRGANGDLKVEGAMRAYLGEGDDPVDPLIAADRGNQTPAFRHCAYVVFENLALADFGNRIPALTFEVFGKQDDQVSLNQIVPGGLAPATPVILDHARGFADEGGAVVGSLAAINDVLPLSCVTGGEGVTISLASATSNTARALPERLSSIDDVDTRERPNKRSEASESAPLALRYYDEDRDYQPGVQRAVGMRPNGRENMVDLPATMTASGARQLANENVQRARWRSETLNWQIGVLDPEVQPGSLVTLPNKPGLWRVKSWEWYDRGIALGLERVPPTGKSEIASDPGALIAPLDAVTPATILDFAELPPDGTTPASTPLLHAAASAETRAWRGASLWVEQSGALARTGSASSARAVLGQLGEPLPPSNGLWLEPRASISIELVGDDLGFEMTDIAGLANGANRLLVGGEVLQFLDAQPLEGRTWVLSGLLRGRAGTEHIASDGHPAGSAAILLDARLTALDSNDIAVQSATRIAAIGRGDTEPVYSELRNKGASRRPLCPVHPRIEVSASQDWEICWTRRARGAWLWQDGVDTPIVEERESYVVGYGDTLAPFASWSSDRPQIIFSVSDRSQLVTAHGSADLWVMQIGTYGVSAPLLLTHLT